jgi:hypothetical protein
MIATLLSPTKDTTNTSVNVNEKVIYQETLTKGLGLKFNLSLTKKKIIN